MTKRMDETQIHRIRGILEELQETISDTRAVFCLDKAGLIIDEIGLDGLGRDSARELVNMVVTMFGKAKKLSLDILDDSWGYAGFIGDRSYLLLGLVGEYAILGLLVDRSEGKTINLTREYLETFSKYSKELAQLLKMLSAL
ncbi:MAG: hypothetical protein ACXAB4_14285 [Candidatus Hodarchaeales archaeon]